jgi:hypothetical protein
VKRVIVRYLEDSGHLSVAASDPMPDEEAEALRQRIQQEHIEAGDKNRWIDVGGESVQSRQIQTISVQEPPGGASSYFGDDS